MIKFHYQFRRHNSAIWHDTFVEAETQTEAQSKIIKELGTDFEIEFIDDELYGEEDLLPIDALT